MRILIGMIVAFIGVGLVTLLGMNTRWEYPMLNFFLYVAVIWIAGYISNGKEEK